LSVSQETNPCKHVTVPNCNLLSTLPLADAKGVVASLAQLLFGFNCNIVQSDQFSDESLRPSRFFQVRQTTATAKQRICSQSPQQTLIRIKKLCMEDGSAK
jgi:formyltetrahydrofolate hydrolase